MHHPALLFDLDGVLIDSSGIHHYAFAEALKSVGIRRIDYSRIAGMKTKEAIRLLAKESKVPLSSARLSALATRKSDIAHAHLARRMPLRKGCVSVLRRLHRSFTLALVSSSSRRNMNLFLRKSKTRSLFDVIVSGDHIRNAKPDPAIYRLALKRLRIPAKEALVIEDSVAGVRAACRPGIRTLAITGTTARRALKHAGAERIFANLMSLAKYAERLPH
jgi:HAD superfamily hydrolase (TIGR01509 family)